MYPQDKSSPHAYQTPTYQARGGGLYYEVSKDTEEVNWSDGPLTFQKVDYDNYVL